MPAAQRARVLPSTRAKGDCHGNKSTYDVQYLDAGRSHHVDLGDRVRGAAHRADGGTQGAAIVTAAGSAEPASFPSSEAGVRRAAADGAESLRRYIQRTRMIYNYYYWNFAKQQ